MFVGYFKVLLRDNVTRPLDLPASRSPQDRIAE
jgi:hypothetical protein